MQKSTPNLFVTYFPSRTYCKTVEHTHIIVSEEICQLLFSRAVWQSPALDGHTTCPPSPASSSSSSVAPSPSVRGRVAPAPSTTLCEGLDHLVTRALQERQSLTPELDSTVEGTAPGKPQCIALSCTSCEGSDRLAWHLRLRSTAHSSHQLAGSGGREGG